MKNIKLLTLLALILGIGISCSSPTPTPIDPAPTPSEDDSGEEEAVTDPYVGIKAIYGTDSIEVENVNDDFANFGQIGIYAIYSIKESSSLKAYGFKVSYDGYAIKEDGEDTPVIYNVVFDNSTHNIMGIYILSENETKSVGSKLLRTESFINQFKGLSIDDIDGVNKQTGPSADVTMGFLKASLEEVSEYYLYSVLKIEKPVEEKLKYQEEIDSIPAMFGGNVTLEEVTSSYPSNEEIVKIYKVSEGSTLKGYAFIVETSGYSPYLYYTFGVDTNKTCVGFHSTCNKETDGRGATLLVSDTWLARFANVALSSIDLSVDYTAIPSTPETQSGVTKSLKKLIEYINSNVL